MKEIRNFVDTGITDEELAFTKSAITLSEALNYETPFDKLNFFEPNSRIRLAKGLYYTAG
jgi:hypothetical protein